MRASLQMTMCELTAHGILLATFSERWCLLQGFTVFLPVLPCCCHAKCDIL